MFLFNRFLSAICVFIFWFPIHALGYKFQPKSRILPSSSTFLESSRIADDVDKSFNRDLQLLGGKFLDTVEDAVLHLRRGFVPFYKRSSHEDWPMSAFTDSDQKSSPVKIGSSLTTDAYLAISTKDILPVKRPRVIVIGSGWAAHAFIKICETDGYDVVCVSPRPFFVFTPMLAATSVGTVEYRSIVEPIRSANPTVRYIEAEMTDVSIQKRTITVSSKLNSGRVDSDNLDNSLTISYDYLIYAAGAIVNNFGLAGVNEHCFFIKEIDDVKSIKKRILDNFERASLPGTTTEEISTLLSFAVVGGGPTGVEFAGKYRYSILTGYGYSSVIWVICYLFITSI